METVSWEDFLSKRFYWTQGEHVSLIGPTGGGKTTLALSLLHRRKLVCVLATKPSDDTISKFVTREKYRRIEAWNDRHEMDKKVVLWPKFGHGSPRAMMTRQRLAIDDALGHIFHIGRWCVVADEVRYLCENLGLRDWFNLLWLQGRSLKISVVAATQRPAWVPLEMYSQATHLFFWKDNDERNLRRIAGLGAIDPKDIIREVRSLGRHEVLYVNTRSDDMLRTRLEY